MRKRRGLPKLPAVAVAVAVALAVTACGDGGADEDGVTLRFLVFEGPGQDTAARAAADQYMADNPEVTVEFTAGSNAVEYPKMVAARETNADEPLYDLIFSNAQTIAQGDLDGMWAQLDTSQMTHADDVLPAYRRPDDRGIGVGAGLVGIVYNDTLVDAPRSWNDLWESPELRGQVVLWDYLWPYNGLVVAAHLHGGDEDNIDPGFEVWSQHTDQIHSLISSTQQMTDLLATGEAAATIWIKGNQMVWVEEGMPFGFAVPEEGAVAFPMYLAVAEDSSEVKREHAQNLIDLLLSPEYQLNYLESSFTGPVNQTVELPERFASDPAFSQENLEAAIHLDWLKIAESSDDWRARWDREVKDNL
ncbi:MAG: extracellular solute-binding protein [Micromonosporaceae bacterium]|nr:extracellular solute-binding protein [Micromonosporaceae bacterium]